MNTENNKVNGMLKKKILINGKIIAKTGLHIGGTNAGLSIGGADATVVRNPVTNEPYIPGSSLKGKMRSMLEKLYGAFGPSIGDQIKYGPYVELKNEDDDNKKIIVRIFGTTPEKMENKNEPTSRLIVRDCKLLNGEAIEMLQNTDMPFTEVKTEVVIDRITSAATPRQIERVPAGAEFELNLILNIYDGEENKNNEDIESLESKMIKKLFEALILVQNDYLGGKGTRGSGEVKFEIDNELKYKDKSIYESNGEWDKYNYSENIPAEVKQNDKQD